MRLDGVPVSFSSRVGAPWAGSSHHGHRHLTRRQVLQAMGATGAAGLAAWALRPAVSWAASPGADPRPIPGGFFVAGDKGYHVYTPGHSNPLDPNSPLNEQSTITDFDGVVGVARLIGTGTESPGVEGAPIYEYDVDLRIMQGRYVGMDGREYAGSFGLI